MDLKELLLVRLRYAAVSALYMPTLERFDIETALPAYTIVASACPGAVLHFVGKKRKKERVFQNV